MPDATMKKQQSNVYILYNQLLSHEVVVDTISFIYMYIDIYIHTHFTDWETEYKQFMWLSPDSQVD